MKPREAPSTLCAVKPDTCPLCGQPNRCAAQQELTTGQPQPPCWCTQMQFSPELLARVPLAAQGKACICAACAQAARKP